MAKTFNMPFVQTMKTAWANIAAANTAKDGTGTVVTLMTAGAEGSKVDKITVRPLGTNVATVLRFFINNGSTNATAANNTLIHEVTLPATTVSEVAALTGYDITVPGDDGKYVVPIPYLPAGYKINMTLGTAISAGVQVTAFAGDM